MKLRKKVPALLLALCAAVAGSLAVAVPAHAAGGTTYYVDAVAGSDTAAGTTTATAWQTLTKVNSTTFQPGDQVLFHADQTWSGQLHPLGSGTAASGILLSSFGEGDRPLIDGSSLSGGAAIYLSNQSYWTIDGFEVVSDSGVDNFGTASTPGVNRSGILVDNTTGGLRSGITIRNNDVHDVNGCFNCNGVDAHGNGGIVVLADAQFTIGGSRYQGVTIQNNSVSRVGRMGIVVWDNSNGLITWVVPAALSDTINILGNDVQTVDGDGIVAVGVKNVMIDGNVVGNAGQRAIDDISVPSSAGIWPAHSINVTIQHNEVYGTLTHGTDGQGYDVDLAAQHTIVQYNYSHDNEGGFIVMQGATAGQSTDLIVRNNLSVNDAWGGEKGVFTFAYGVIANSQFYNNTVYVDDDLPSKIMFCEGCDAGTGGNWSFRNNIVANFGSGDYTYPNAAGAVIDHNLFYGSHPASEPVDSAKLTSDPQFVSASSTAPTGIGSVAGYQVGGTSPAVSSGTVITGNGGLDFFGRTVSPTASPTRGFFEAVTY